MYYMKIIKNLLPHTGGEIKYRSSLLGSLHRNALTPDLEILKYDS
jgi:hypothetical protein